MRILLKVVEENPSCSREKYYLAREYWYRKDYKTAIYWYYKYTSVSTFAPELADAYLMTARCFKELNNYDEARKFCIQAVQINTNFKEAILLLAELSGPKNKKRWVEFANSATNEDVLFVRN